MNLWTKLENQQITREQLPQALFKKLGAPQTEVQRNLAEEILKKITAYYFVEEESQNYTVHILMGCLTEISERKYKEGKNKGQTYYVLKLASQEKLQTKKEHLSAEKWTQIQKSALLGQNLVFKYRKWFNNRQVLDFYKQEKSK